MRWLRIPDWIGIVTSALACVAHGQPFQWSLWETLHPAAQADAQFGWSMAGLADVTGNGFGDLAIGAHYYNVGTMNAAGAVFLYEGGRAAGTQPFAVLLGQSADEHFGESVAGGDINADGLADVVVGARLRGGGRGAVDIFLTGSPAFTRPWATVTGETTNDWFGQSVAVGDVNGDGVADIIVGAPYNPRGGNGAGAVFIYLGGVSVPTAPWRVLVGEGNHNHFGWSVAFLGDFTGNGFGDVAVGARLHGVGPSAARGKAYVFEGGPNMATAPARAWLGAARDDWFGQSVAAVGDVDGRGRADLVVGAPYNDVGGNNAGAAYLFLGEDPPGSAAAVVYVGQSADAQFGWAVGGAGDVTGNGRADVIVGARMQAVGSMAAAGRVYLFQGGAPLSTTAVGVADGVAAHDWFGCAVCGALRFGGEARHAVVGGAPLHDAAALNAGAALIYLRD